MEVYVSGADAASITVLQGDEEPVSVPVDPTQEGWQLLGEFPADPDSRLILEVAEGQDLPARVRLVEISFLDRDRDNIADFWEKRYGLDPTDPTDAALDPDGDGIPNLVEFSESLDPARGRT